MRIIIIFINHLLEVVLSKSDVTIQTRAIQATPYEDIRQKQKFHGNTIKTLSRRSQNGCSMECNRDSKCRCFLFCGRSTCVLLNDDLYSTEDARSNLVNDSSCKYIGMTKPHMPECKEGQDRVKIQNDLHQGQCNIRFKRIDHEWTEWEHTDNTLDDGNEYKKYTIFTRKNKINETHGGIPRKEEDRERYEEVELWLKWVKEELNWDEAIAKCKSYGGQLYGDLDGTEEQLALFRKKMGNEWYWLGIYTEDHKTWKKLSGDVISGNNLLWAVGQPNNAKGIQFYVAGAAETNTIEDMYGSMLLFSVCQKKE